MNLINHKNGENLAFMRSLQFLPNLKLFIKSEPGQISKIATFFEVFVHSRLRFVLPFFKFLSIPRSLFSHLFAQGH